MDPDDQMHIQNQEFSTLTLYTLLLNLYKVVYFSSSFVQFTAKILKIFLIKILKSDLVFIKTATVVIVSE